MSQEIRKSEDDIQASHFLVSQLVSHPFWGELLTSQVDLLKGAMDLLKSGWSNKWMDGVKDFAPNSKLWRE
jgi:hypothetical protein